MTHANIFTKFMIEYDKANITSSYPSLTDYEIATILDKAYLAIIALKLTGNNPRKAFFESDTKAIEDLRPLIRNKKLDPSTGSKYADNDIVYMLPGDLLYYLTGRFHRIGIHSSSIDSKSHNIETISLMSHSLCEKFMSTDTNLPWIKKPVSFIEQNELHVLIDTYKTKDDDSKEVHITYLKKPAKFTDRNSNMEFELSDTMAEELINLAIVFATNAVESSRLQSQTSILNLES